MVVPGEHRRDLVPGRSGPAIIAHGGGNAIVRAHEFIDAGADYLEVDLWLHRGRFEARHERRTRWLPLLFEKWYLRRVPSAHHGLEELLEATAHHDVGIFLDLKNGGREAAILLRRTLAARPQPPRVVASSQQWRTLRAMRELNPEVDTFYSIDVRAKLDLFLSVVERDTRPRGVSCRHGLLNPRTIGQLHQRGLLVVAWTVDDLDRAHQLVEWGVDGLTTHNVDQMCREFVR
jgi:glycerophosphoryl diester phosphodiesterase